MLVNCACKHPAQDAIHGVGRRVYNETKDATRARCTVCGTEKGIAAKTEAKVDKKAAAKAEKAEKAEAVKGGKKAKA